MAFLRARCAETHRTCVRLCLRLGILEEQPVRVNGVVTVSWEHPAATVRQAGFQARKVGYEPESSTPEVPLLEAVCPEGGKDLPRDFVAVACAS